MFAAPSMACSGWGCQEANGSYQGQAVSFHKSYCGQGNDWAKAGGNGSVHGIVDVQAEGFLYASESGWVKGYDETNAWSYARDYGQTSKSGAGVTTEGSITTSGKAFGFCCDKEVVDSTVTITGDIFQSNYSAESGYNQFQGIDGFSSSSADFVASDRDVDTGWICASDKNKISGNATVQGHTRVSIDPYGSYRSFDGKTCAMSYININGASRYTGSVIGNGGLGGLVQNNGTYASAIANFSYTGSMNGSGGANINANIFNGGNYSSVSVSGSSHATGH